MIIKILNITNNSVTLTYNTNIISNMYTWSFNREQISFVKDGIITINNLIPGNLNFITINLSTNNSSSTKILEVYTKPYNWTWGKLEKDSFISDFLTANKWNQFVKHIEQFISWKKQENYYNYYQELRVQPGDFITADLYNKISILCNGDYKVTKNSLITSELFINLENKINEKEL